MIDPQELRSIVTAWWEDTFVNDYVIDRSGNYRNADDCIEDIVIRARAALRRLQALEGQVMTDTTNTVLTTSSENRGVVPARVESGIPKAYRLIMQGDGNGNTLPALQGLFTWTKGSNHGAEWRTLETQECPFLDDSIPFGPIGAGGAG